MCSAITSPKNNKSARSFSLNVAAVEVPAAGACGAFPKAWQTSRRANTSSAQVIRCVLSLSESTNTRFSCCADASPNSRVTSSRSPWDPSDGNSAHPSDKPPCRPRKCAASQNDKVRQECRVNEDHYRTNPDLCEPNKKTRPTSPDISTHPSKGPS